MLKQLFLIVALLSVLHLVALIGLGLYLWNTGKLDAEKVEEIVALIRGEDEQADPAATSQPAAQPVLAKASGEKITQNLRADEVKRLMGERLLREAADRKALVDAAMLKVTKRLEALEEEKKEFEAERKLAEAAAEHEGMQAELEILAGLSEKNARDVLMKKQMPEAVAILLQMKRRNAAGIIEACKTEAEKAWAVQVLEAMSNESGDSAEELAKAVR